MSDALIELEMVFADRFQLELVLREEHLDDLSLGFFSRQQPFEELPLELPLELLLV